MPSLTKLARVILELARHARDPGAGRVRHAVIRDATRRPESVAPRVHLDAILQWIHNAHDATGRQGVSRSYSLRQHPRYQRIGWLPAYPETTGYIIPTLYESARLLNRPEDAERALEMAQWEVAHQLDSGAVRGGTVADEPPTPAAFNTGQVLLGWVRAAEATGDAGFDDAAGRAAAWLVDYQDADGGWRRGASKFARGSGHVYNARTGWGLCRYGKRCGDKAALAAARQAAEFALQHQTENGWFSDNCLDDAERPLTHTIAYAAQGVLEIGLLLEEERFVEAARKTARSVAAAVRSDGMLPGRLDQGFRAAVNWNCLTGTAQMVIVWDRLTGLGGGESFRATADRALSQLLSRQDLESSDPGVRGGIAGSYPVWGDYGAYEYLSWAAKFTADALLGRLGDLHSGARG